ncbi:MAG: chemotaxis response regulator protein-glutamate methylesterase [Maricaulis sp.]|jgi:two-component system chemotaxis response regulator CheB|uniref:protein-glutamate methylesterase/protein-glutamine glutaminase n=1 Tax=Maricaulis sp. TaxID=1486257 RepID=UPI001B147522|nr:chemotaxis response regulator protein-glutamate methylesterase [Maricaulis sp.]MBO6729820.1 chemotaxis response regulator protein-glutamate methylesterase [Maricaulis sp.]MBO6846023.1 chemotaxis response regulator protein-glutamate methylesterase [Maricaulis sp.]MBO6876101.1 chemotaxis response regulator protein-glutamate methylesterase [Maricaulis sp.]
MARKIRTLVVDDSALMRMLIPSMLQRSPHIEVVGAASNPFAAREMIKELNPDVITLDVEMPKMDGISFLHKIMTLRPTPVVMVSSLTQKGADVTLKALELGAIDFIGKPTLDLEKNMPLLADELIEKVRAAAVSKVRSHTRKVEVKAAAPVSFDTTEALVALGASTGGVETLGRLLGALPPNAPGIVIAQHMPAQFTKQFAERINKHCAVQVAEAEQGQRIRPGTAWIAPGDRHLEVRRSGADYVCRLTEEPPVSGHRPSVDVLFNSVAKACGAQAIGVILTGMGRDGADGLKTMRDAGCRTIGQDEATSLVYGMPKAAFDAGAVETQLPEDKIPSVILRIVSESGGVLRI